MKWILRVSLTIYFLTIGVFLAFSLKIFEKDPNALLLSTLALLFPAWVEARLMAGRLRVLRTLLNDEAKRADKLLMLTGRAVVVAKALLDPPKPTEGQAECWTCGAIGPKCTARHDEFNICQLPKHPGKRHSDGDRCVWDDPSEQEN